MERQATQPAAVPSGRKRRRVCGKKKETGEEEAKAQALDKQAAQPPTSELVLALKALPRAQDPPQTVNDLMQGTLKEYEEECVEEGTAPSQLTTEAGDSEDPDLDQMDTQLNDLLYEACPFHPHQFLYCVNPQTQFGPLRFKCPQEGCPVYLFEDTREIILEILKEDIHPQVRARVQRGYLKCKCGLTPKMKLGHTAKNYNKVFLSCGNFAPGQAPCGYFQWIHGPLWAPRDPGQPSLRRWVKDTPPGHYKDPIPLLRKREERGDGPSLREPWLKQFAESVSARNREFERKRQEYERRGHRPGLFGSGVLF